MNAAEIIESVFQAIHLHARRSARVAILATLDAIREPSEEMIAEAMADTDFDFYDKQGQVAAVWRAMIDALKREIT